MLSKETVVIFRKWGSIRPEKSESCSTAANPCEEIHAQISHLQALEQEMDESLDYLERCRGCSAESPSSCNACSLTHAPMLIIHFNP